MKTILVPTDFSPPADNALQAAKFIAAKFKATIHLANFYSLHVVDYSYPEISMPGELLEEIRKAANEGMRKLAEQVKAEGFEVKTTVEMGLATDEIVELAKKENVDLIIMGTTGASGLLNRLIGSNAANVMQRTEKPIILVPKDCSCNKISRIVYADSLQENDTAVLKQLFAFAEGVGAQDVSILNINTSGHYEPVSPNAVLAINEVFGPYKLKLDIADAGNLEAGIDKYLEDHQADLVVMSTHKKTLMERIFSHNNTRMMALHTRLPLMVYHS